MGQESTNTNITIPDRKLFKVSGTLVAQNTQQPLRKIDVNFQRIEKSGAGDFDGTHYGNQIKTDEFGRWSFKDLPKGLYRIEISPNLYNYKSKIKYAQIFKEIKIEDEALSDIVIELPSESTISGTLRVENKKEIPSQITIYLLEFDKKILSSDRFYDYQRRNNKAKPAKTKWDFRVGSLSAGKYELGVVIRNDTHYVKSIKIGRRDVTSVENIELDEGENLEGVEIVLADDIGILKGKVKRENGSLNNIGVILIPTSKILQNSRNNYFQAITNANGDFEIKAAPGEYFITFPKREYYDLSQEERIRKQTENAQTIKIEPNKTTTVTLDLN